MNKPNTRSSPMSKSARTERTAGIFAHGHQPQLTFDGDGNTDLPDVTDSLETIPLPTPNTWFNQQLASGMGLDLSTPSLDALNDATFNWSNSAIPTYPSMTAIPEISTSAFQFPPTQSQNLYHTHELPSSTQKLPGSNTYLPFQPPTRPQSQEPTTLSYSPILNQLRSAGSNGVPSAGNMSTSYTGLPSRPPTSGGDSHSASHSWTDHDVEGSSSGSEPGPANAPRKVHKEKNRIAAAKTRRKKKTKAKEIEEHAQQIEETNTRLHQEVRTLRNTFSTLRYCALSHDPTAGCTCVGIHQYNAHMANEVAKEVAKKL